MSSNEERVLTQVQHIWWIYKQKAFYLMGSHQRHHAYFVVLVVTVAVVLTIGIVLSVQETTVAIIPVGTVFVVLCCTLSLAIM